MFNGMIFVSLSSGLALLALAGLPVCSSGVAANDDLADATPMTVGWHCESSPPSDAGIEPGEPEAGSVTHTVWWRWT